MAITKFMNVFKSYQADDKHFTICLDFQKINNKISTARGEIT